MIIGRESEPGLALARGPAPWLGLPGVEQRRHRLYAEGRVAGVLQAGQPERLLQAEQQRVVVVRSVVYDVLAAVIGDHDGGHVAAARVGTAAARARLPLVGEVVLVPGDDDGVAALLPYFGTHDHADGGAHVGVTRGDEPVFVAARGG